MGGEAGGEAGGWVGACVRAWVGWRVGWWVGVLCRAAHVLRGVFCVVPSLNP